MSFRWKEIAITAALSCTAPALAQKSSDRLISPETSCELHLVVSDKAVAGAGGDIAPGLLMDLLRGGVDNDENARKLKNYLSVPEIMRAFSELDLPVFLHMPVNTTVVPHIEPLPKKSLTVKARRPGKHVPCYVEIVVLERAFDQNPLSGGRLYTTFDMRAYAFGKKLNRAFLQIPYRIKWLGKHGAEPETIRNEITTAFKESFLMFIAKTTRPLERRRIR